MKCKICDSCVSSVFTHEVLAKYQVNYYKCNNCGYLFTEEPYWITESYLSAIANADTGILQRNLHFQCLVPVILQLLGHNLKNDRFIDYAGGGGIFVRLMRDVGLDFYWTDKYCMNWVANGFEADLTKKYDALTLFECLEHLEYPINELKNIFSYADTIIASTELLPQDIPDSSWWYYSFQTGQHIGFYSVDTLKFIAKKFNKNYYCLSGLHVFTNKSLSIAQIFACKLILRSRVLSKLVLKRLKLQSKTFIDHECMLLLHNNE